VMTAIIESAVRLNQVAKTYTIGNHRITALHPVTRDIPKGVFWMLTGPSGCGKSTLLNLVGCIDTPDTGRIDIAGMPVSQLNDKKLTRFRREHISFIFQNFSLVPVLTAQENVEYPLRLAGIGKRERETRAGEILERVGLGGERGRRPKDLSGGQQQRVAIARALVKRPSLVLADEPTANLDSATGDAVVDLMRELQRSCGATFLFSTHDSALLRHADQVVRMRDGQFITTTDHATIQKEF